MGAVGYRDIRRTHDQFNTSNRHCLSSDFKIGHHFKMNFSSLTRTPSTAANDVDQGIGDAVDDVGDINENIDDCQNRDIQNSR